MRTNRTRYQHLGDHLKNILDNVMHGIDVLIDDIGSRLPDLHSEEKGVCQGIQLSNFECENGVDCNQMYKRLGVCEKHRRIADEVWKTFIDQVISQVIPRSIDIQLDEIKSLKSKLRPGPYPDILKEIVLNFGNILQESFQKLHDTETYNHEKAINMLIAYKKQMAMKTIESTGKDCVNILKREGYSVLKSYARDLNIPINQELRDNKRLLIEQLCNVQILH